jgi:glyoxylase-like metal-dependent hydrolase (beta-lactamase superfamily II)
MSRAEQLEPGLWRLTAPNPSPMTCNGTNTYLLGQGRRAVIDPGPADAAHLEAILAACPDGISHILVTHAHLDHSPLAAPLALRTGAPVLAYGPALAGRSAVMERLAAEGLAGGGEGLDRGFVPDIALEDGAEVAGEGWQLRVHWTPGHVGNHICLGWGDRMFTGDHVMGWASSLVSPPDGDLTQFLASCRKLQGLGARRFFPGHGAPVEEPEARLAWLIAHREARTAQILAALAAGGGTVGELTARVYTDIDAALLPMAERNLFAHLIDLCHREQVTAEPRLAVTARFRCVA